MYAILYLFPLFPPFLSQIINILPLFVTIWVRFKGNFALVLHFVGGDASLSSLVPSLETAALGESGSPLGKLNHSTGNFNNI